jgi:hypothetical protein
MHQRSMDAACDELPGCYPGCFGCEFLEIGDDE